MSTKYNSSIKKTIIIAFTLLAFSCVDNKYDLEKEIELKISFGENGLTIPTSSTGDIELNQIVELKENGQLTTDLEGNYLFYKANNDMDSIILTTGQGSLCNATESNYTYHFKQDPALETTIKNAQYNTAIMTFCTDISPNYQPDHMTDAIKYFEYIKTPLSIDIQIMFNNVNEFTSNISEIRYEVPSFYDLVNEKELTDTQVSVSGTYRHTINTKGVNFKAAMRNGDKIGYDSTTGEITMIGHIKMYFTINTAHMNEYEALKDPQMDIRVIIGTLGTNEVTGRFAQKEQINVDPITFEDLPDIIQNEEVAIDLENPMVRLTVDNSIPARALVNATLKSYRNETEIARLNIGEKYGTDSIKFEGEKKQTIWISRVPTVIPDTVSGNVVVGNIMDLLKKMPDKIEIDGWANTDSTQIVTLGLNKDYIVRPSYELVAPLIIGPNMKLVYTKETDSLHSTMKSIEISSLTMKARAINKIPLDLTTTMIAKDIEGNKITGITLLQSQTIKGLDESDITLTMTGDIEDFQKMDILEIKAYAESNEQLAGHALNKNQALRIEDIKVTVK